LVVSDVSLGVAVVAPATGDVAGIVSGSADGRLAVAGTGDSSSVGAGDGELAGAGLGGGGVGNGGESNGIRVSGARIEVGTTVSVGGTALGMIVGETVGDGNRGGGRAQLSSAKANGTIATSRRRPGAIRFAETSVLRRNRCIVAIRPLRG
jgi:hypothetical protein